MKMQNDLISRSALMEEIKKQDTSNLTKGLVLQFVEKQPSAYDVEKVVEDVRIDCCAMGFDESQAEIIVVDIRNGGKE